MWKEFNKLSQQPFEQKDRQTLKKNKQINKNIANQNSKYLQLDVLNSVQKIVSFLFYTVIFYMFPVDKT